MTERHVGDARPASSSTLGRTFPGPTTPAPAGR